MNNPVKSLRNAHIFVTNNTREYPPQKKIIWEGVRGIFLVCTEEGACFGNFYYVNLRKLYFHKGGGGGGLDPPPLDRMNVMLYIYMYVDNQYNDYKRNIT